MTSPVTVGLLYPGQMGAAVGHELTKAGVRVLWCPAGRSEASVRRAEQAGLEALPELGQFLERSSVSSPCVRRQQRSRRLMRCGERGGFLR